MAGDPISGDPMAGDPISGDPISGDPIASDPGPYDFSITLPNTELHLPRGETRAFDVQIDRTAGFHESVTLEVLNLPTGVSVPSFIVPDGTTSVPGRRSRPIWS